jgi:hydroxypyruvate isomerase
MNTPVLKFSVADWAFFEKSGLSPKAFYARLKELGYNGVEMVAPERLAAAKAAGLEILNTGLYPDCIPHGLNRRENHDRLIPRIKTAIAEAREQGIQAVIIFSGNRLGQPDNEGMSHCRAALEKVLPDAENAGVTLLFEVFNIYDHPDYQADNSRYAFSLARSFNSPAFKVLYDIYHMERMAENAADILPANMRFTGHLHVADAPLRDRPKADGLIAYAPIVKRVMAAGYQGYWGMEFFPGADPLKELAEARDLFSRFLA